MEVEDRADSSIRLKMSCLKLGRRRHWPDDFCLNNLHNTLLDSLSDATPDSVYFTRIGLANEQVTVSGMAENAAEYQTLLSGYAEFDAVVASSAFTRDTRVGLERFTLTFGLSSGAGRCNRVKRWFLNLPRPARSVVGLSLMLALALFFSSLVGIFRLAYDSVQSANLSKPKISQLLGYEASVNQMAAELAIQRSILSREKHTWILSRRALLELMCKQGSLRFWRSMRDSFCVVVG